MVDNVRDDLKQVLQMMRAMVPALKETSNALAVSYAASSNLREDVEKLYEIVVTGNGRPALVSQIVEINGRLDAIDETLKEIRTEYDEAKQQRSTVRLAVIIAVITSLIGPILVAIILKSKP